MKKPRKSRLIKIIKSFNNSFKSKPMRLERLNELKFDIKSKNSERKRLQKSNVSRMSKNSQS
jgi:hypothetical protein